MTGSFYLVFPFIIIIISNFLNYTYCSNPVVSTSSGSLRGSLLKTWSNKTIFSFRGIPFAEPPVGNLRFKAPAPVKPWKGIRSAIEDGKICPQIGKTLGPKDEDCLFVNVYSKNLKANQPVIVFFHPGGFYSFTGASYWFGPDYLLDHDIVLVTVNYRLDALGFLSTGDSAAPGNNGLKDQVEALRWIKKNINNFGGNPNEVTITGYSVGSTCVLLHMFSPMTKDLFHRVIAMSAGVTANWVVTKDPLSRSRKLAGLLNCKTNSTRRMVECLRNFPADDLTSQFRQMRVFAGRPSAIFGPVIEPDLGNGEERYLTDYPVNLLKKKQFHQVPVVTGITDREFITWGTYVLKNETLTKRLNEEFNSIVPALFSYENKKPGEVQKITNSLREFYLGSGPITSNHIEAFSNMFSDHLIIYGAYTTTNLLAKYNDKPVYFYKFNYVGEYGFEPRGNKALGPAHHDDLIYLFYVSKRLSRFTKNHPDAFMVGIETTFWKNFASTGNPTPDGVSFQWTPLSEKNKKYLSINTKLKMEDNFPPFADRMKLWESILPVEENCFQ